MPPATKTKEFDALGLILGFAGFFIVIGLTLQAFPDIVSRGSSLADIFANGQFNIPYRIGQPIIFFLTLAGIWGVAAGGLRAIFTQFKRNAIGDVIWGFFAIFVAALFRWYYGGIIGIADFGPLIVIGLGLVIVANVAVWYLASFVNR